MQRVWSKARESRPSIFQSQTVPLISRYTEELSMTFEDYSAFFRSFVDTVKPKQDLDIFELHRLLSQASGNTPDARIMLYRIKLGIHTLFLSNALPGMLLLRSCYLDYDRDEQRATDFAVERGRDLAEKEYLPYQNTAKRKMGTYHIETYLINDIPKLRGTHDFSHLHRKIDSAYDIACGTGIETDADIARPVLEAFSDSLAERYHCGWFGYPCFDTRLVSVLGGSVMTSLFEMGRSRNEPYLDFDEGYAAAIAMFPWEADHTIKSMELRSRGIPAAEAIGKALVDEMEFAFFRWVRGKPLDLIGDPHPWECFGAIIRRCHENGIRVGDPAGRNAIWDGSGVNLIDFEHVTFDERGTPMEPDERDAWRARIDLGIYERGIKEAFLLGYDK